MANKVKYGLSNVYYAVATIASDGTATYATPVAWKGAVNLSLDAEGDVTKFRADNIDYWIGQNNNGYSGSFESALVPDSFLQDVLGAQKDQNDAIVEMQTLNTVHFALLFQFEGDAKATRHVLYNCTASRPSVGSETTGETTEPVTETLDLTASSIYSSALSGNIVKAKVDYDSAAYSTWFGSVYQPTALTPATT